MRVVIVGNGVAGITAARTIRESRPEAQIEVYTAEDCHYYPRPQLIELLAGQIAVEQAFLYDERWYRERNIEVHLASPVEGLDPNRGELKLRSGEKVGYDCLLLATGARPALPEELPGIDQEGVFTLRILADALRLRERAAVAAAKKKEMIVLGGGLLGLEAASALASSIGVRPLVLERRGWPLSRQLDRQGGELLMRLLRGKGVEVVTEAECASILEGARGVALVDGRLIEGDFVLVAAGIEPNCALAGEAGLKVNKGIIVDEHLRTSAPGVYAAGDAAEFQGKVYGIIPAAIDQAKVAALNIIGKEATYRGTIPSNTLKVSGLDLFSAGEVDPKGDGYEELRLLDTDRGVYKKLVFRGGRLVGAILLGTKKNAVHFARLIATSRDLSGYKEELLADDFDFRRL
ncbi:MAG: NAD(P)/FAD-dependent oxidoreductase [Candidatus Bipolaricaulia bacterium]